MVEGTSACFEHPDVQSRIAAAGRDTLSFLSPSDWVAHLTKEPKMTSKQVLKVVQAATVQPSTHEASQGILTGELVEILEDGLLAVRLQGRPAPLTCAWLESAANSGTHLSVGDPLLVHVPQLGSTPIVMGRIGRYNASSLQTHVTIEAADSLVLRCGEASIDLRSDGKVLVKGDDVVLRAKGTQRIRAGTVAIN